MDDVVRRIEGSLLGDALGEDGGLGDVKLQASILLKDMLELRQDLKRHAQVTLDVSVVGINNRPGLLQLCENTSPEIVNTSIKY